MSAVLYVFRRKRLPSVGWPGGGLDSDEMTSQKKAFVIASLAPYSSRYPNNCVRIFVNGRFQILSIFIGFFSPYILYNTTCALVIARWFTETKQPGHISTISWFNAKITSEYSYNRWSMARFCWSNSVLLEHYATNRGFNSQAFGREIGRFTNIF